MGSVDGMISAATAALGYKEGRNNDTPYGKWYGLNYNPWCDMAVSKWAADSGNSAVVGKFAYCPSHVNWFKARGQWHGRTAAAKRGDIVFFSWDGGPVADHVGVVTEDAAPGADIRTIEGNTSAGAAGSQGNGDGVYRRTRARSLVLGFGRPAYDKPRGFAPFPGTAWFKRNPRSPLVTAMGKRLVAVGCSAYRTGPGPQWTDADRLSYAKWQRKCGFTGADADGWPGKTTWDRLKVPAV
ncbi:peptidoglycan-binding protein [Streptomyces sp. NPDC048623]|uniref:peptidoglycan-binding protein n=1 Tax=Streptomyces sp. NPDC048623 TaxID=3155761 RepID=UPI00344A4D1E